MDLSPGVELVWSLAGRETINAKAQEVEPDHFFCALLKFAELSQSELAGLALQRSAAEAMEADRKALVTLLSEGGLDKQSSRVRHALRRAMEHGDVDHVDETLHRSEASRALFERAARLARKDGGPLRPAHLYAVLTDNPTSALTKVLADEGGVKPRPAGAASPRGAATRRVGREAKPAEVPAWLVELQEPTAHQREGKRDLPEAADPQGRVIAWAVGLPDPSPILLICEPKVSAAPLVSQAAEGMPQDAGIIQVDLAALRKEAKGGEGLAEQVGRVLGEAEPESKKKFFIDGTKQKAADIEAVVAAVQAAADEHPRVILAVSAADY